MFRCSFTVKQNKTLDWAGNHSQSAHKVKVSFPSNFPFEIFVVHEFICFMSDLYFIARRLRGGRHGDGDGSPKHILLPPVGPVQPLQDSCGEEIHQFNQFHRRRRLRVIQARLQHLHQTIQPVRQQRLGTAGSSATKANNNDDAIQMEIRLDRIG